MICQNPSFDNKAQERYEKSKKMKSKKQIEKGCGKVQNYGSGGYICRKNKLCKFCQATLTQINEIIKMIKQMMKDSSDGDNEDIMDYNQALIELLTKLKGENK